MTEWKLNEPNVTFWDRLKICSFFLNPKNFWTMGKKVALFEKGMADYVGSQYAVYVSSGSTANTLLAMYLRDNSPSVRNVVLFPSTTWTTSVSPFIREGFDPHLLDINLSDLSMDLDCLEAYLKNNHKKVVAVFITSLLGFVPDMARLQNISAKYKVRLMMDNCENTLGSFNGKNVSSLFTSTTSTYFGHQLQSVEGGFIFTNCSKEYDYFLMARNHGLTRAAVNPLSYRNPRVNAQFDFCLLGNNFRNTDIHAFIGLLDLKRAHKIKAARQRLYRIFYEGLSHKGLLLLFDATRDHCPFGLPVPCSTRKQKKLLLQYCAANMIDTRPIISGNLLRQTAYKKFGNRADFSNSEYIDDYYFYVGLHPFVKVRHIKSLVNYINTTNS